MYGSCSVNRKRKYAKIKLYFPSRDIYTHFPLRTGTHLYRFSICSTLSKQMEKDTNLHMYVSSFFFFLIKLKQSSVRTNACMLRACACVCIYTGVCIYTCMYS